METRGTKLTRARIEAGVDHAVAEGKDVILWCVEPVGFACRIRKTGAASFIYQYRVRGGRNGPTRKLTIGKTSAFSPEEARNVARRCAQTVAMGGDPQRDKMAARAVPTVLDLFLQWEQEEGPRLSPRTVANARSHMKNQLGTIASTRIDELRRGDVARLHARLGDAPYAANRAMATLSALYAFAERRDLAPPDANPVKGLVRYRERHRERMLDAEEVAALWGALIDLQAEARHRFSAPAIMMGMLTGWRVGEVRTLRWEHVDMVGWEALIIGKTGERRAPLPSSTHRLLAYLAEASRAYGRGRLRGAYVFPSTAGKTSERGALTDWEHHRTWVKAVTAASLTNVRRHDLRHLIAGVIGMQTGSALRVKEAMGHRSLMMSERYVSPITALQRQSTEQAAALVLAVAEREAEALLSVPSPQRVAAG